MAGRSWLPVLPVPRSDPFGFLRLWAGPSASLRKTDEGSGSNLVGGGQSSLIVTVFKDWPTGWRRSLDRHLTVGVHAPGQYGVSRAELERYPSSRRRCGWLGIDPGARLLLGIRRDGHKRRQLLLARVEGQEGARAFLGGGLGGQ